MSDIVHSRVPPASVGQPVSEIDTPALVVELDSLERNLQRMAAAARRLGVALRPHAKSHKCLEIARRQVRLGAVGITCQKVSEAEIMVDGGIEDVLIANEVVAPAKLRRLAELAGRARVSVCVDDEGVTTALDRAAAEAGSVVRVLVEVNTADYRAGVPAGEPAADLAVLVDRSPNLELAGLQAYNGPAQHTEAHADRRAVVERVAASVAMTVDLIRGRGLECSTVTGAGTGSFELDSTTGAFTEIQPGSYVFMDGDYAAIRDADDRPFRDFEQSLHVLCGVMSLGDGVAIVDAGSKAVGVDRGMPLVAAPDSTEYVRIADEHGWVALRGSTAAERGDHMWLVPMNCDPTVNLYDWLVGVRGGVVEEVWRVAARGAIA